jgi:hypothetical protein
MEDIAPPLSVSDGLFLHDDDQSIFIGRAELDEHMPRFGETLLKPLPLRALPSKRALVDVLDECGARNLFCATVGAPGPGLGSALAKL